MQWLKICLGEKNEWIALLEKHMLNILIQHCQTYIQIFKYIRWISVDTFLFWPSDRDMCWNFRQRGILCIKIPGIVHGNREMSNLSTDKPNHKWNAVFLAGRWRLVDCTWGAGYVREQTGCFYQEIRHHYIFTYPRDFIRDHFPLRSEWQL